MAVRISTPIFKEILVIVSTLHEDECYWFILVKEKSHQRDRCRYGCQVIQGRRKRREF